MCVLERAAPVAATSPECGSVGVEVSSAQGDDPVFYVDYANNVDPHLDSAYTGWEVSNATGAPLTDIWVRLENFSSPGTLELGIAPNEPNAYLVGDLDVAEAAMSYIFLTAEDETPDVQNYDVVVYEGDPRLTTSSPLCVQEASYLRVDSVIQANSNQVGGTLVGPNPPGLGGIVTLTVDGTGTGTLGSGPADDPNVFWMTPSALRTWQPNAYKLVHTELEIDPDGNGPLPVTVYEDQLRFNEFTGGNRPYTITYTFVAIGVTDGPATVYPIQNIASGTQVKHTSTSPRCS